NPGQQVTLEWFFKGNKISVSGGRFGKGVDITGRTSLTDKPIKTTKYIFDVWYTTPKTADTESASKPAQTHAQYSIVVEVIDPKALGFETYRSPNGWLIQRFKDWKADAVPLADASRN